MKKRYLVLPLLFTQFVFSDYICTVKAGYEIQKNGQFKNGDNGFLTLPIGTEIIVNRESGVWKSKWFNPDSVYHESLRIQYGYRITEPIESGTHWTSIRYRIEDTVNNLDAGYFTMMQIAVWKENKPFSIVDNTGTFTGVCREI